MQSDSLYEPESERAFLGFLLLKGADNLIDVPVVPEDFYVDLHRRVYRAIADLVDKRITIDPVSVLNFLKENSLLKDEEKEFNYIYSLYRDTVVTQPLAYYATRIKRFSERRMYAKILQDSLELIRKEPGDNESVFNTVEKNLTEISRSIDAKGLLPVSTDKVALSDYIMEIMKNRGQITGLRTNFTKLDEATSGLKEHELMILAARPGNGKTTFALNIASNVALDYNQPVVIFSLEMSRIELLLKMVCAHSQVESMKLKKSELTRSDAPKLLDSIVKVTAAPIYIDDSGGLTIDDFKGRVRKLLTTEKIGLIVVDYLQLMSDPKNKEGGRQQEVASISRSLKQMAKEAKCPIIALSQMSRAVEQRSKDQKPQLSDLRESGAIEQDADIVSFIYREEKVKGEEEISPEMRGKAEIIIAKNRSGPIGSFHLAFRPELSRFDNID
ncbi:replicative DNA helicase [Leptospira sp. FAT2]|uniref:replicative DNA helicase n=1 Tax=Leptospira sanjuanensis TaxID=2879643 RepID=UPI001EE94F3C|nr:replicative DNA helicase [Leptospira sanjuanensis]MCG6167647.1 replicative DNA helicase [Leptospira sanjuanensis]MCG6193063.1 replicative DNA helicase [Leptospira sanjuanensis]